MTAGDVDERVASAVRALLEARGDTVPTLSHQTRLNSDLAITSVELAQLAAGLDESLRGGSVQDAAITDTRTLGDLCARYGGASGAPSRAEAELAATRRRATERRGRRRRRR